MGAVGVFFYGLGEVYRGCSVSGDVEVFLVWEVESSFCGGVIGVVVKLDLHVVGKDIHNGKFTWLCCCCQPCHGWGIIRFVVQIYLSVFLETIFWVRLVQLFCFVVKVKVFCFDRVGGMRNVSHSPYSLG